MKLGALEVGDDFETLNGWQGTVIHNRGKTVAVVMEGRRIGREKSFSAWLEVRPLGTKSPHFGKRRQAQ